MSFKVAVVGATGAVGREMLKTLAERNFPISSIIALASKDSAGKNLSFGEKSTLTVGVLADYDFSDVDIALFSAGGGVSMQWAPKFAEKNVYVIDNSSQWRMDPDVALVVPEVNADDLGRFRNKYIIANPNCSTIQLVTALKPLHDFAVIKRVVAATYQSVSGAGKEGMDELYYNTKAVYEMKEKKVGKFAKDIAFNVIPQIDVFMEDGYTREEWKMMHETRKILDPNIEVSATCVRVPVFIGHSEAVNIEFAKDISPEQARRLLSQAPGVKVFDDRTPGGYVTPVDAKGEDDVFVSRIRRDATVQHGLCLWIVADNLRKGAALNAVQIAEEMVKRKLITPKNSKKAA